MAVWLKACLFCVAVTPHHHHHEPKPPPIPVAVSQVQAAADSISDTYYSYGGGHASFDSTGYDCSGSVSYALHGAGLIDTPQDSTGLESFGEPGEGHYITVYANSGHAWMTVQGRRFDTVGGPGPRWHDDMASTVGFVARHPAGL